MSKLGKGGKSDRRHLLCSIITLLSILFGFLFPNSIPRLIESIRDFGTSVAFYFCQLMMPDNNPITPTINQLPSWQIAPELWQRVTFFPETWEEFGTFWTTFLGLLFNRYNFLSYWYNILDFIFYSSRVLMLFVPLVIVAVLLLAQSKEKTCTQRGLKSPALVKFERFLFREVYPRRAYLRSFKQFLKDNPGYVRSWCVIWALHFNLFAIGISLIGYYFYFVSCWDLLSIYTQLLKLQRDLTPVVRFIPGIVWLFLFAKVYNWFCKSVAFDRLYAAEHANRCVLESLGIMTCIGGEPGAGKTQLLSSMALSAQVKQFDDAFQIMINRAAQFPNFPWQTFRDEIQKQVDLRNIVDIASTKKWVSSGKRYYNGIVRNWSIPEWQRICRRKKLYDYTFGYDYIHYRSFYNDELKIVHLYDALESYAAAFLLFSVSSNLIFSNYSIRTDTLLKSKGNLPLRDNDFFTRNALYQKVYSQHAHIFDFNIIRLGKKFQQNLHQSNGAPVGVIVVTEIDKEFKNMQLLKETKINDEDVNQKNDLHDAALMMIRHGAVIDFKPFVCVFSDLQRPEAWGAGGRELGSVVNIADKSPMLPLLPFFSSYWLTQGVYAFARQLWDKFYADYQYRRSDETLAVYLINNLMTAVGDHYERLENQFGMQVLDLEIQSGKLDGDIRKDKWRKLSKKDYANRARTDCLESVWDKGLPNTMHIDDFKQYAGELATREECDLQNSFFQKDVHKIKENNT